MAKIFGKILRINHDLNRPVKRIAICKFKGLGSIVQATPLMQGLKEKYPQAELIFVTASENKALLQRISYVDTIVALDEKSFLSLLKSLPLFIIKLWRLRADIYIDLEIYSNFSSIIACLSLATNRFGYFLRSSQYRLGMYTHMMFFNLYSPISQTYLQMGRLLNIPSNNLNLYPFNSTDEVAGTLEKFGIEKNAYILVNPNCSDLRLERRWPISRYTMLLKNLIQTFPEYKIVLTGSRGEKNYVDQLEAAVNSGNVLNLSGKTTFDELIELIKKTRLMVTNDSGPMHLAFALQTKTVSLFGPCSPQQYGFYQNSYIIYKKVYCSPCVHDFVIPPCKGDNQCMKMITVSEVFELCSSVLNGEIQIQEKGEKFLYNGEKEIPLGIINRTS